MKSFICGALTLLVCMVVEAKSVSGLYDSKVLVLDQQLANRQEGAQAGLMEVLQKVSGFAPPVDNVVVRKALGIADQYLYQFSYATLSAQEQELAPVDSRWLNMRFEGKSIQRLIKAAKLPRWGKNRPNIMVWLAVDEAGERQVIADDSQHSAKLALQIGASKRGLPLMYPIYDLEDSMKLPVEQLWGLFPEPVQAASVRYGAQSILAARLFKNSEGKWQGQWSFFFRSIERNYVFETESLDEQVLSGLTAAGQVLANHFALKPTQGRGDQLNIEVKGVGSLRDYALLGKYLEKLAITKRVIIKGLKKNTMAITLTLNGNFEQFKQTLSLDKKLIVQDVKTDEESFQSADIIHLRWRP